jgi:hypothetical protein
MAKKRGLFYLVATVAFLGFLVNLDTATVRMLEQSEMTNTVFIGHTISIDNKDINQPQMPSKQLCKQCLQIVLGAPSIDLSFVNVHANKTHLPHMGTRDEHGNSTGFVYDVTRLSRNPPPLSLHGIRLEEECRNNDTEYVAMQRLSLAVSAASTTNTGTTRQQRADSSSRPKILCAVYGMEKKRDQIHAIRETWGPKCDGFFIASSRTDPTVDAIHIPQLYEDAYHNMWQKVRSMWSYIYDNYYNDFDWFHIGGDDMWVIVENLREYLGSEEIQLAANGGLYLPTDSDTNNRTQTPLYLGSRWLHQSHVVYNTGGPGEFIHYY